MQKLVIVGLALVHLLVTLWHSGAHDALEVALPPAKLAYAYAVIVIAPPVAAAALYTRFERLALWVFTAAMVGSLLFATYHHYVLVSPDNIAHLPEGPPEMQARFVASAGWSAILELGSALVGAFALGRRHAGSA